MKGIAALHILLSFPTIYCRNVTTRSTQLFSCIRVPGGAVLLLWRSQASLPSPRVTPPLLQAQLSPAPVVPFISMSSSLASHLLSPSLLQSPQPLHPASERWSQAGSTASPTDARARSGRRRPRAPHPRSSASATHSSQYSFGQLCRHASQ